MCWSSRPLRASDIAAGQTREGQLPSFSAHRPLPRVTPDPGRRLLLGPRQPDAIAHLRQDRAEWAVQGIGESRYGADASSACATPRAFISTMTTNFAAMRSDQGPSAAR
jgi:hypothetical protein